MKINEAKPIIYNFFKNKISDAYSDLFPLDSNNATGKIFWDRVKQTRPQKPYIMLSDLAPQKIYKRYEEFEKNGNVYVRKEMRMPVTFGVYTIATNGNLAASDNQATDLIEYIQDLFTETNETFISLSNQGITINELESSEIRDLSAYSQTNQEFRKEIDIVFEFQDVAEKETELGQALNVQISVDNTSESITVDFDNL